MAVRTEQSPRQFLSRRGPRGYRAMAHATIKTAMDHPTLSTLHAAEQAVAQAGSSIKSVGSGSKNKPEGSGFQYALDKILKKIREPYVNWMQSRDISQISPDKYQSVYDAMELGTHPRPPEGLGATGSITNTDRKLLRYLIDIQSGSRDISIFSSYISAIGHDATASVFAVQAERARILGLEGEGENTQRSQRASAEATTIYRSMKLQGDQDQAYARERGSVGELMRDLFVAEQAAIELDPTIRITSDPNDVRRDNTVLLTSEIQAQALQEMHRKLQAVGATLTISSLRNPEVA